ncbi:MAG: hypothetical protein OEX80_10070 [Candidatus Aminicenantes bacterium]|nr:hypothetical protein [Candidatus Aminicenantes bacterium]
MFRKHKEKEEKLPAPREIPGLVQKHLIAERKMDPDLARILKAVVCHSPKEEKAFNIRIFDESEAGAKKIQVKDYTSLDKHPDLIIYEGWFNEAAKQVELEEKKAMPDTTILTEAEIKQKIEGLSELGSTVFFYQARGPAQGGPLGRGCAVVELNPSYPEKKGKKYIIYTPDVIDMQPVGKGQKLFDSNKPKDVAHWIKEAHHKRLY